MATPILWSKLDSADDVTSPQLCGTGGEGVEGIGSPTYTSAKFSEGIYCLSTGQNCLFGTSENSINLDKGTIEFWCKMGFPQDVGNTAYIFWDFIDSNQGGMYLFFDCVAEDFTLHAMSQGTGSQVTVEATTTGIEFSVDDLVHIGCVWDRTGADIGSSKTLAIYINETEEASSTTGWATDAVASDMYVGSATDNGYPCISVIDNLKTYDECKTNFSDRFDEGISGATSQKRRKIISPYFVG